MLALRAISASTPFLFLIPSRHSQTVSDQAPEMIESFSSTSEKGILPASGRSNVLAASFPVSGGFYDSPSQGDVEAARQTVGLSSFAGSRPPTEKLARLSQDMEREMELLRGEIAGARQKSDKELMRPAGCATPGDLHGDNAYAGQEANRDAVFTSPEDGGAQSFTASLPHDVQVEGRNKTPSHVRFPSSEGHIYGAKVRSAPHIQEQPPLHDAETQNWELEDVDDERSHPRRCAPEHSLNLFCAKSAQPN